MSEIKKIVSHSSVRASKARKSLPTNARLSQNREWLIAHKEKISCSSRTKVADAQQTRLNKVKRYKEGGSSNQLKTLDAQLKKKGGRMIGYETIVETTDATESKTG